MEKAVPNEDANQKFLRALPSSWTNVALIMRNKDDGTIKRFKARLVAKGYTQQEGFDYKETFALVVKMVTVRALLALAVHKNWLQQTTTTRHSFKLKKSLYRLKQANRQWFTNFSTFLLNVKFKQSYANTSLFTLNQEGHTVMLLLYVDDILLARDHQPLLKISKSNFITNLLHQAEALNYKPVIIPLNPTSPLNDTDGDILYEQETSTYRTLVRKLIYLTITRPDFSYAAQLLTQFSKQPRTTHKKALHKVLHYIKLCPGQGLHFPIQNSLQPIAYCDSDWAACPIS
ncbi:retrovirus-related pol polyprotein from transposon TNT 1-94 [Tanacetum coccineum]